VTGVIGWSTGHRRSHAVAISIDRSAIDTVCSSDTESSHCFLRVHLNRLNHYEPPLAYSDTTPILLLFGDITGYLLSLQQRTGCKLQGYCFSGAAGVSCASHENHFSLLTGTTRLFKLWGMSW
jgi:hypothetical protein